MERGRMNFLRQLHRMLEQYVAYLEGVHKVYQAVSESVGDCGDN